MNQAVSGKLESIRSYYRNHTSPLLHPSSCSLMGGKAGSILIQSLFFQVTGDANIKSALDSNLEQLIDYMESSNNISYTFCGGLAGIGWLFQYLSKNSIINIDTDIFLEDLDVLLEIKLNNFIQTKNFDILHGAMGLGVYFLARDKWPVVEKLLDAITTASTQLEDEIMWEKYDDYNYKDFVYDFGLAHGNAAIAWFLGKCFCCNIRPQECRRQLTGLFHFFLANVQNPDKEGSFFPSFRFVKEYKRVVSLQSSRLAWCYGDLGILHTLFRAARWINDPIHEQLFLSMLEKVAARRLGSSMVQDAGFCHGASGVGYIFLSLYRLTQNNIFLEASSYWLDITLSMGERQDGILGYQYYLGKNVGWVPSDELLMGLGGTAAFFLNYHYDMKDTAWDECFFLS